MGQLARDVELAFVLWGGGAYAPIAFERALELHVPHIKAERAQLEKEHGPVTGFNLWAEKYGVPQRAKEVGGWVAIGRSDLPEISSSSSGSHIFTHPHKHDDENTKEYLANLRQALTDWEKEIRKVERRKSKPIYSRQLYHAEWYVLYKLGGCSKDQIADWENRRRGQDPTLKKARRSEEANNETIERGIKLFSRAFGKMRKYRG